MSGSQRKPPTSDKSWERTVQPLYGFLQVPRSWVDLSAWSRRDDVTRQCLAWLEGRGRIRSFYKDNVLYWTRSGDHRPSERRRSTHEGHDGDFHPVNAEPRHLRLPTPIAPKPAVLEPTDNAVTLEDADQVSLRETGSG